MLEIENIVGFLMGKAASSVKGLEFESGSITLEESSTTLELVYTDTHDHRPCSVIILDVTGTLAEENTMCWVGMIDWYDAFGEGFLTAEGASMFARYQLGYKTASASSTTGSNLTTDGDGTASTDISYYSTAEKFTAYSNSATRFFAADRIYQWIAVWAPALPAAE